MKILIIIPCYNEANRLPVKEFDTFLSSSESSAIDLLFVNDGSKDETIEVLKKLKAGFDKVNYLDLKQNVGKAEAIRQGILLFAQQDYDYLGYFDADLATPLNEINRLKEGASLESPYLIMGSRVKLLGSTDIRRKLRRHYIGRVFATVVSNMLQLPIYDTQCGAKLIKKEVASVIFDKPFLSKWLFDVELLFRIKKKYSDFESKIVEVPLKKWEDKDGSKISTSYFLKAPLDLLKIYLHYK